MIYNLYSNFMLPVLRRFSALIAFFSYNYITVLTLDITYYCTLSYYWAFTCWEHLEKVVTIFKDAFLNVTWKTNP